VLRIRDVYPGSWILDPIFSIPDPGVKRSRIRTRIKKEVFLTQKTDSKFSKIRIRDVHPRSPNPGSGFFPPRIQGVKKEPDPGSRIRIRNTSIKKFKVIY
jgi:hypothetical protein